MVVVNNQLSGWQFIEAESFSAGYEGEKKVWDAVLNISQGTGFAIWGYFAFQHEECDRREIDILLVSQQLGIVIIEVKSIVIDNIRKIEGNNWKMQKFYKGKITPYAQAEKQGRAILKNCQKQELILRNKVKARAIVALPNITRTSWRQKGFDTQHTGCPPIIFEDDLNHSNLLTYIENNAILFHNTDNQQLNDQEWVALEKTILSPVPKNYVSNTALDITLSPRAKEIFNLKRWISDTDWEQVKIGIQIPPGPQRIRGMAGCGKTMLLCQKAARMHLCHPEWNIAFVFFTRSLYELVVESIDEWLMYFSGGKRCYDAKNSNLKVLHAWGSRDQEGLYRTICSAANVQPKTGKDYPGSPENKLAAACSELLKKTEIPQIFDAILIDEGQDLIFDNIYKVDGKQPFYWMAHQSLKAVDSEYPDLRRLIWAYDEAQSLNSLAVPTSKEIFGTELSNLLGGSGGGMYGKGIRKAHILSRSYRTPGNILIAAHAIGMGLLRTNGMLTGITTKKDWERIGYKVTQGDFRKTGDSITLERPLRNSPNPVPSNWNDSVISFNIYNSWEEELKETSLLIKHNIEVEGVSNQDILVIVLGEKFNDKNRLKEVAESLRSVELNYYIPTAPTINYFLAEGEYYLEQRNRFWCSDGITVSGVYRAKGHEASIVYVIGLDYVASKENNITIRNQLFVAMTRAKGWVNLSGTGSYQFYSELEQTIASANNLKFSFQFRRPHRDVTEVID